MDHSILRQHSVLILKAQYVLEMLVSSYSFMQCCIQEELKPQLQCSRNLKMPTVCTHMWLEKEVTYKILISLACICLYYILIAEMSDRLI